VIGTSRASKHAFLAELGADEAIDYTSEAVEERVSGVDVVLDLVGGEASEPALSALRDGGLFIAVPSASALERLHELAAGRVRVTNILVEPDRTGLEALAGLVERSELRVAVERTFPLAQAGRAHELGETGRTRGKLVLTMDEGA
jgi:NADPH:quinone reductase-like Zn-dependent oxidoreductase